MLKLVATLSSYGRRAVVVGGVADRYASELARAGQSNRQRAGTGSAAPQRATRPPLWPAGMAEGNRATFGPRVGLSSHGSPAKGGPKSKCLARVKIARTWAGPPSLDDVGPVPLSACVPLPLPAFRFRFHFASAFPLRFPLPLPASASASRFRFPLPLPASRFPLPASRFPLPASPASRFQYRTCPASRFPLQEKASAGPTRPAARPRPPGVGRRCRRLSAWTARHAAARFAHIGSWTNSNRATPR